MLLVQSRRDVPPFVAAAGGGEPDEAALAQGCQPGGVSEVLGDHPADLGPQHVRQRDRQPGKGTVQLAQQLVLQG
jgi:hypothetical protein